MKALDSFTVERLEELIKSASLEPCDAEPIYDNVQVREIAALARIALTVKRAEPVGYWNDACDLDDGAFSYANDAGCTRPLYTTPQLNSPEIPEGWKLVPNVVTTEMTDAARIIDGRLSAEKYHRIYRLMLAAAPEKPL